MRADELDLPYLAMETPEFASDPYPPLAEARAVHPWLARCAYGYVVHQYKAIEDFLRQDATLISDFTGIVEMMEADGTPWGEWSKRHILSTPNDTHDRIRAALASKFTPRRANENRELMRETIADLLDDWAPRGAFDFEEFASYFPITVMCTMIGADPAAVPSLRKSLEALGLSASMLRDHLPALNAAFVQIDDFSQQLVAARRGGARLRPQRDMLDDLIEAVDEGGLTDRELYDMLVFMFAAGYDTSKNMLTIIMDRMIEHSEIYRRCAEDRDYCRKVMEEALRFANPGTIPRTTRTDATFRGVTIPAGTMVFFPVSIAGRDPSAHRAPDDFDPDRERKNHLAFGMGMHMCLGQFIARAQIQEGLHLIAQRIRDPRRAGPSGWRPFYGVWGMRGLPITFTPAQATEPVAEPA